MLTAIWLFYFFLNINTQFNTVRSQKNCILKRNNNVTI